MPFDVIVLPPKVIALPVMVIGPIGLPTPIVPVIDTAEEAALIVKFLGVASEVTAPLIATAPPAAVYVAAAVLLKSVLAVKLIPSL